MGLTRVAISRPVFILMVILALVLTGAISFTNLNQELYPSINVPVVTVSTAYSGASPDDIERLVTKPIEDAVSGLSNVDFISSTSAEGRSIVSITFTDRANADISAVDVERRVSGVRAQLPSDASQPVVSKFDFTASPVIYYAVSGAAPLAEIFRVADVDIRPRLEALEGVSQVALTGGLQREIQVQVDPAKLAAYNLTYDQINGALTRENQSRPGGSINQGDRDVNFRVTGAFQTLDEMSRVVISNSGAPVYLRDVATIVDTTKKISTSTRLNGNTAVALTVSKSATANEVRTADNVKKEIAEIEKNLPEGMTITQVFDRSRATKSSLEGVERSLIEAVIITGLILLLFLHTLRSTAIVLFAIPTSLLTTFLWMNILGFTLNVMSTLALVLVIGVLVDDSIVVIENIVRHLGMGEGPWQAALNGRSEIGLAAIAITLVDVVVFLPVGFLSGTTGGFFKQFGLVIVAAVLTSLFISFTLTPMLASKWMNAGNITITGGPWGMFSRSWERAFTGLEHAYQAILRVTLTRWGRFLPPALAVLSLLGAFALPALGFVKFEFIPSSDDGIIIMDTELPPGSSLSASDALISEIEPILTATPEIKNVLAFIGSGSGQASSGSRFTQLIITLKDRQERSRDVYKVIADLKPKVEGLRGAIVNVGTGGGFSGPQPVVYRVTGQNRAQVEETALQVEAIMKGIKGAENVKNSASLGSPEYRLAIDRDRLADQRLTADQVASALRTTVDGAVPTKFRPTGQNEVDVRVISTPATRSSPDSISAVTITVLRDGQPVQVRLSSVTRVENVSGPNSITRRNRQPVATIGAGLAGTTPLNDVTVPLERQIEQLRATAPRGVQILQGGEAQEQAEAFSQLLFALGLSIVLIYMLLAALYESFILPFATMFSLPVALVGAFLGLAISQNTLNILSMIGMIVLMALVAKNGILLVDYTNTLRQRGRSRKEALLEAGPTRLRPILMTSAALCFGLLPIAAKLEEGSAIYASIGALIIGGMITSTLLSLLVVPSMYTFFDDLQGLIGRAWRWRPFRRTPKLAQDSDRPAPLPAPVQRFTVQPEGE